MIGTKAGLMRSGPAPRENLGLALNETEAHVRGAVERSLRLLRVDRIDLYPLHRVDPATPIEGTMRVFRVRGRDRPGTDCCRDRVGSERLQPCNTDAWRRTGLLRRQTAAPMPLFSSDTDKMARGLPAYALLLLEPADLGLPLAPDRVGVTPRAAPAAAGD